MAVPTSITDISTTAASNSPAGSDAIGSPGTIDDYFRGYGAVMRTESLNKSWERWNDTPTYIGATQFSVTGDKTARYVVGRRVKATVTAGTVYGRISVSAFGSVTTVTVVCDSGSLDSGLSEVQLGPETYALGPGITGTGNRVFATSPTFITPTLGAATATSVAIGGSQLSNAGETTTLTAWTGITADPANSIGAAAVGKDSTDTILLGYYSAGNYAWIESVSRGVAFRRLHLNPNGGDVSIGAGRLYGAAIHNNASAVTGTTNQYIASGTYTPTVSNTTNISSTTPRPAQWIRVGNVVHVTGVIASVTLSSTGSTAFSIDLPIASTFGFTYNLAGVAVNGALNYLPVTSASNLAKFAWTAAASTTGDMSFSFSYVVL